MFKLTTFRTVAVAVILATAACAAEQVASDDLESTTSKIKGQKSSDDGCGEGNGGADASTWPDRGDASTWPDRGDASTWPDRGDASLD